MILEMTYRRKVPYGKLATAVVGINGFEEPLLQINIRLRNGFKFNLYHPQGKFNRQQFDDIFFFPENRVWHFMQAVSVGDSMHEMSNPVFWNKSEKYFKTLFVDFFLLWLCNWHV